MRAAVNGWVMGIITSALQKTFDVLSAHLVITPLVGEIGRAHDFWSMSMGLANSLLVLLFVLGGVVVMGHDTVQASYSVKEILPRMIAAALLSNGSLMVCDQLIVFSNALSRGLLGSGFDSSTPSFGARIQEVTLQATQNGGDALIVIGLVVALLAVVLVVCWLIRVILTIILVVAAPLALVTHTLPGIDGIAELWWRAFAACLGSQVGQALVLAASVQIFFGDGSMGMLGLKGEHGLVDLLMALCMLWVMVAVPFWAGRLVFRGQRTGMARRAIRAAIYARVYRRWLH